MVAVIVPDGVGERWEMEPGRPATFRVLSSQTGGAAAVFEERVPPGAGTPLHIHHTSDELILVRSGSFRFRTEKPIPEIAEDVLIATFTRSGYELVSFDW